MSAAFLIDCLGWTLLHFVWQGVLIGCVTALLLALMRNASPLARYNVACAGLLACVLWPAAELTLRLQGDSMVTAQMRFADALFTTTSAGPRGLSAFIQSQMLWIVGLWASCAALLAARMGLGLLWIARSGRGQRTDAALQMAATRLAHGFGVARQVRLRVVQNLASPQTAGFWRPVILVPASLVTGMPADLLAALLAHEMAHIKRHDYVINLAQHAIEVALFYQPAVWWISGRIRAEREQIADDLAARHTGAPRTLARALAELERMQFSSPQLALAANGGDLLARVTRLIRPAPQSVNWAAMLPVLGLATACISFYAQAAMPLASKVDQPATAIFSSCAKPVYPAADLLAGHSGTVRLYFEVGANGQVLASQVDRSSGHAGLDEEARSAIAKCSFRPALAGGKPVRARAHVRYVWVLE